MIPPAISNFWRERFCNGPGLIFCVGRREFETKTAEGQRRRRLPPPLSACALGRGPKDRRLSGSPRDSSCRTGCTATRRLPRERTDWPANFPRPAGDAGAEDRRLGKQQRGQQRENQADEKVCPGKIRPVKPVSRPVLKVQPGGGSQNGGQMTDGCGSAPNGRMFHGGCLLR